MKAFWEDLQDSLLRSSSPGDKEELKDSSIRNNANSKNASLDSLHFKPLSNRDFENSILKHSPKKQSLNFIEEKKPKTLSDEIQFLPQNKVLSKKGQRDSPDLSQQRIHQAEKSSMKKNLGSYFLND